MMMVDAGLLVKALDGLPLEQREEALRLAQQYYALRNAEVQKASFMDFVKGQWNSAYGEAYVSGAHHKIVAEAYEAVASGKCKRLIVCLPPRHMKSVMGSVFYPAWAFGKRPSMKMIQASNTTELARGFGAKVRDLLKSPSYSAVFSETQLASKISATGMWKTSTLVS